MSLAPHEPSRNKLTIHGKITARLASSTIEAQFGDSALRDTPFETAVVTDFINSLWRYSPGTCSSCLLPLLWVEPAIAFSPAAQTRQRQPDIMRSAFVDEPIDLDVGTVLVDDLSASEYSRSISASTVVRDQTTFRRRLTTKEDFQISDF